MSFPSLLMADILEGWFSNGLKVIRSFQAEKLLSTVTLCDQGHKGGPLSSKKEKSFKLTGYGELWCSK